VTPSFEAKICEPGKLAARVGELARPLVFTNGVFDLVHRGHVTYLAEARALGKSLVVALNSDASAKRLGKGDDRPINGLEERLAVVAALESVSLVTWFDEDTPIERIIACRPEHLVKGGDWAVERIVGAKEVASWGGVVHSIPFRHDFSTTKLLSRIRT
jgi:D-glycero-beta-D-manno-heptose 1-phosphate adenylyltransferase